MYLTFISIDGLSKTDCQDTCICNTDHLNHKITFIPRSFYNNIQLHLTKDIQNNKQNKLNKTQSIHVQF